MSKRTGRGRGTILAKGSKRGTVGPDRSRKGDTASFLLPSEDRSRVVRANRSSPVSICNVLAALAYAGLRICLADVR
jgi:hypothetical protein